jgi:phytoene desaturase (3,4-didehydrolycopene-forming)
VTVLEKNEFAGGRCSLIHDYGYRFDQGPSLLLLPDMFREAFTDLDTSLEAEGVELRRCDPNYIVHFGDGENIELSTDVAKMKKTIESWEGKEGFHRYLAWMQEAHMHYELSVEHVLRKNFTSLLSMCRPSFLRYILQLHPFESIWRRASHYFYTERLRRAFTFGSMYMGMSPFDAPGTYSLLQYTELAEGIWLASFSLLEMWTLTAAGTLKEASIVFSTPCSKSANGTGPSIASRRQCRRSISKTVGKRPASH